MIVMAHQFTTSYLEDSIELLRYYKRLAARALEQCPDDGLFTALDEESNSIAIIVKHMAGNMKFFDHRRRKARSQSRFRIREWRANTRSVAGHLGNGMELLIGRARTVEGRRFSAYRDDSCRAAFGDAGDQSPNRALFLSHWADYFSVETFCREIGQVGGNYCCARPVQAVCLRCRRRKKITALVENCREQGV
jgi:hypothetical protein